MPKLKVGHISPSRAEDRAITLAAELDPDSPPLTDKELAEIVPMAEFVKRGRGRPPIETPKERVTIRMDADIVEQFKSGGAGWQTRMNNALREWVETHKLVRTQATG